MFDIAPSELLLVAIVALIAIGPKDLPLALRSLGKWMGKMRRMSNHFRAGVDAMIREAELAEIEKEWQERNKRIMAEHPDAETLDQTAVMTPLDTPSLPPSTDAPPPRSDTEPEAAENAPAEPPAPTPKKDD
ncbi:Sec-independent protein translocase protein TatB [Qipengyuania sp.]|uniref:Sec-independent protein translocase protein TatB n=1 Tax=Qipengyuania sp. TaxID=2004515 RepID=UPI0035C7C48A